jgi:hypothetical protein
MAESIEERIETDALNGIASTTVAGQTTEATPLKDLIEADRYLANKQAAADSSNPGNPLRIGRIRPVYE